MILDLIINANVSFFRKENREEYLKKVAQRLAICNSEGGRKDHIYQPLARS
jgi:hypothetical protein